MHTNTSRGMSAAHHAPEGGPLSDAPEEAMRILAHLAQHRHVRGCIALRALDAEVVWSGGAAFASTEEQAKRARIVAYVRALLDVAQHHKDAVEEGVCVFTHPGST